MHWNTAKTTSEADHIMLKIRQLFERERKRERSQCYLLKKEDKVLASGIKVCHFTLLINM